MYKSSTSPAYPECQEHALISGVRDKVPIPVEDHLAKYVSAAKLAGIPDLTMYLAEEKPAYKARGAHKGKYLDPRTDFGFKTIFRNEFLLRSFINPVLKENMEECEEVGEVHYTSTEALGKTKKERVAFLT